MTPELEDELVNSKAITKLIDDLRVNTDYEPTPRASLTMAYAALNLEHQSAICVLIEQHHRGSAFALLRSQVEACYRGLWVQRLATDVQVEAIWKRDAEPFPRSFKLMAEAIDADLATEDLFQGIVNSSWKTLNSFTHSGLEQLSQRFNSSGDLTPNYSDAKTERLLRGSASVALLMHIPLFRIWRMERKAEVLEAWLIEKMNDPAPQKR
ncbi:hypothetical protein P8936_11685 [Edaphobacter paludis]|uniref:Uncharacterized protein n=1 Tax=Edaphobacter paludis TaxID=3035702 RepID=A0AAU7D5I5_9BACT